MENLVESLLLGVTMDLFIASEFNLPESLCMKIPALNQNIPKLGYSY
jgi:hypothetical protein